MKRKIRKFKLNMKKTFKKFTNFVTLFGKLSVAVLFIFFFVFLILTKPSRIIGDFFENSSHQASISEEMSEEEFIERVTPVAKEVERTHGVRPSVLIAQAALESSWGNSTLSKESNNYFGIKDANGQKYATNEFYDNEWETVRATFKEYPSLEASIIDYANLLNNGTTWNSKLYHGALEADNYVDAANAVSNAGYATDPDYASKLIHIIEQYNLDQIDN